MVIRSFDIKGEHVFDVGLRQGLTGYAGDYGLKAYIINARKEGKVKVVVSGELDNIECYHAEIKKLDVRIFEKGGKYEVGELSEYEGPDIEWGGYLMAFMGGQMYKGFKTASKTLEATNQELASIKNELSEIYGRFGIIGKTLEKIDKKIPDGFGQKE